MFVRLFEMGYSPIPVQFKGKNPIINEWTKYCIERPSQELIEQWDAKFEKGILNIGVTCGKASGIIVLDIDSDDKDFLTKFPLSPVVRRGSKGEARFFRYSQELKSASFPFLDILSDGRQVIIPPSTHPLGMQYKWLSPYTLENTRPDELPELDIKALQKILPSLKENKVTESGRNNKLKNIVTAMRGRGENEYNIIKEIYEFDKSNNNPRLFSDRSEGYYAKDEDAAFNNAAKFFSSINASLIKANVFTFDREKTETELSEAPQIDADDFKTDKFIMKPYPKARGIMGDFMDYCELVSAGKQDVLSLGGAISLMSILASNKYITKVRGLTTCPNTYIINLGYSGFGKETAQKAIQDLIGETGLLGAASYRSGTSIILNLPSQQERLDIIDECSSLLKAMGGREDYKSEIVEILSSLFTKGSSKFIGFSSAEKGQNFGACYNPHVNILGSTTPNGFKVSVNREMAAKGLLPRFLLFFESDTGRYKGREDNSEKAEAIFEKLKKDVNYFLEIEKIIDPNFVPELNIIDKNNDKKVQVSTCGYKYIHNVIPMTKEAMDLWLNYEEAQFYNKSKDPNSFESAFIGRFAELSIKLALLDTLSLKRSEIEPDSIRWAIDVIEAQWHNAKPLYELAHAETKENALMIKVISIIETHGAINRNDLVRNMHILTKDLDPVLKTLIESNQIVEEKIKIKGKSGPASVTYRLTR